MKKFGVRGVVRGATMGLALVNMVGGGLAYTAGSVRLEALQVGIAGENQHGWEEHREELEGAHVAWGGKWPTNSLAQPSRQAMSQVVTH
jgi:hypothetical protein